eukprot:794864-Pleurochrysis_carterae.AAC.1
MKGRMGTDRATGEEVTLIDRGSDRKRGRGAQRSARALRAVASQGTRRRRRCCGSGSRPTRGRRSSARSRPRSRRSRPRPRARLPRSAPRRAQSVS